MDCRELTNDLLADHAGWKLAPEEQGMVSVHLETCVSCRGRRDEVGTLASALRNTAPRPPAALLAELDRAVLGALPRRERRPRLGTWAAAAALLLSLTALVSIRFLKPGPATETAVVPPAPPDPVPEPPKPDPLPEPPKPAPVPDLPQPEPAAPKPEPPKVETPKVEPPKPEAPKPPPPAPKAPEPPPPPPRPAPPPPPKVVALGDVDGDGVTDIADARRIQQALVLGLPLPPEADVNGDGVVDVADVRQITRAEVAAR